MVEIARKCVGDKLRVTVGSGAVDRAGSQRFLDAGADSCCYNLETWDKATFEAGCPGKTKYMGRDRWIQALVDAAEVFGWGNVASAFVAGLEMRPPAPGMSEQAMIASILEGAAYLLDRGIMPLYSPLWPVEGTVYGPGDGISRKPTYSWKPTSATCAARAISRCQAGSIVPVAPTCCWKWISTWHSGWLPDRSRSRAPQD